MQSGAFAGRIGGAFFALIACSEPSLDVPRPAGGAIAVELQPESADAGVSRLFRARLRGAPASAEPWLFSGELSSYHAQAIRREDISATLLERAQPLRYWREGDDLWLQTLGWLEAGQSYALALTGVGAVQSFSVSQGEAAVATRLFPSQGEPIAGSAIFCDVPDAEGIVHLALDPGALALRVTPGVAGIERAGCVTFEIDAAAARGLVLPPSLNGVLLGPQTFAAEPPPAEPPLRCDLGPPVAGGCLEAQDDRLLFEAPIDTLWLLHAPRVATIVARRGSRTELARGLAAASSVRLAGRVLRSDGSPQPIDIPLVMAARRRHVVLNEVLANPRGAEPEGEWIEIINDADDAVELDGLYLEDGASSVPLPSATLKAGEIALLVPAGFRASGLDVAAASDVARFELPSLGARGLANGGEALLLVGSEGVVSRFPEVAAPTAGRSVARRSASAADDDASAFAVHAPPGASPGAPNELGQ